MVVHQPLVPMPGWVRHTYALAVEDGAADGDGEDPGVSASRILNAGKNTVVRFVLTWHQPYVREGSRRAEKHIYATRFADAKGVAAKAIASHQDWLRRILAWQDVLYGSDLPDWLCEALITAPYALTKNSLWLARTRPDDWWGDEGLWLVNESFSTCTITETMPCRFFGHWPALFFFPELERITLNVIRHFQLRDGEPPFCFGSGFAIRAPYYHCQHTCGSGEYAQMIYRYYLRTGDREFLDEFYSSARDALTFMMSLDKDGDGLVEDHPHTLEGEVFPANNPLDAWPWHGVSSYTAGKGLAALVCGVRMAEEVGDKARAEEWGRLLRQGQKSLDERLWAGSYYRMYNDVASGKRNDASFSAQLSCVWCTRVLGCRDPLPPERIRQTLASIAKLNVPASPFGMVDAVFPDGSLCVEGGPGGERIWSRDIFIQCNATAAMVFLYYGEREVGELAGRTMLDTIFRGPHAMPWAQPCGLSSQTGKTCHGHDYYDHMVIWSYPLAFAGQNIREACTEGGLIDLILKAACGTKE
jgi:uncharacterized protein (DUF608 family)